MKVPKPLPPAASRAPSACVSGFDLDRFDVDDMYACSAGLRRLGDDAPTPDAAAALIASYLFERLHASDGEPACALVRVFRTASSASLVESAKADLRARFSGDLEPGTRCLALCATRGILPEWNDPARSRAHRLIPLKSEDAIAALPMVRGLLGVLGGILSTRGMVLDADNKLCGVFHVPEAAGSPLVPD